MSEDSQTDYFNREMKRVATRTGGKISGVPSGFTQLDSLTGGWQDSDLIVVGSRPTMGKTSFLLTVAENAALDQAHPRTVAIFSLEMSEQTLAQRMMTSRAKVNARKLRAGEIDDGEAKRLEKAAETLRNAHFHFDDRADLQVEKLLDECRHLDDAHGIDLVVVDYLQLLRASDSNLPTDTTHEVELGYIAKTLKTLAKELDVPVIVSSQLNRDVENRGGAKLPQLTDLRGSGSIEEHADVVAFIYRAERYGITVDPQGDSTEGIAEILVEKQRNGPTGVVKLGFKKQYARFETLSLERRNTEKAPQNTSPSVAPPTDNEGFSGDPPF